MTTQEVEMLELARKEAMLQADVGAMNALLADDLTWIHASSKLDDKSSFLRGFSSGDLRCFRLDDKEQRIRIFGTTAVVTGIVEMESAVGGMRRTAVHRYTCLWVSRAARPQLVLWQSTRTDADK